MIPITLLGYNGDISCKNGQLLSIYGDFCNKCQECPIKGHSDIAMSSNCSKITNHFCPKWYSTSKICMDNAEVSITDYCHFDGDDYWKCPKANKGLNFDQCYYM